MNLNPNNGGEGRARDIGIQSGLSPDEVAKILEMAEDSGLFSPDSLMAAEEMAWESAYGQGRESHAFLVARDGRNGAPVGFVCFGPIPHWPGHFEMYGIAVAPGFQRMGIGTALVNEMKRLAALAKGKSVFLETGLGGDHEAVRRFYEANSFFREHRFLKQFIPNEGGAVFHLDLYAENDEQHYHWR